MQAKKDGRANNTRPKYEDRKKIVKGMTIYEPEKDIEYLGGREQCRKILKKAFKTALINKRLM